MSGLTTFFAVRLGRPGLLYVVVAHDEAEAIEVAKEHVARDDTRLAEGEWIARQPPTDGEPRVIA